MTAGSAMTSGSPFDLCFEQGQRRRQCLGRGRQRQRFGSARALAQALQTIAAGGAAQTVQHSLAFLRRGGGFKCQPARWQTRHEAPLQDLELRQGRRRKTFSGQEVQVDGQKIDVLVDAQGGIILEGNKFVWSNTERSYAAKRLKIEARNLGLVRM